MTISGYIFIIVFLLAPFVITGHLLFMDWWYYHRAKKRFYDSCAFISAGELVEYVETLKPDVSLDENGENATSQQILFLPAPRTL